MGYIDTIYVTVLNHFMGDGKNDQCTYERDHNKLFESLLIQVLIIFD